MKKEVDVSKFTKEIEDNINKKYKEQEEEITDEEIEEESVGTLFGKPRNSVGNLVNFSILIVIMGMILGVSYTVLDRFTEATATANTTIDMITPVLSEWTSLTVTIMVLSIILGIVVRALRR